VSCLNLALETASSYASVALLEGERLIAEVGASGARPHSARVLPAIHSLLELAGASVSDLGGYAVSVGPGSFTGLRVGVATVKGLAFGDAAPVAAVSTLAAVASSAIVSDLPVLACLDARRGEVYAAVWSANREVLVPEGVYGAAALAEQLPGRCVLVGCAGEEPVLEGLAAQLPVTLAPPQPLRAWWVGVLGARLLAAGEGVPASELAPRYVRRAEAEVRRTGLRFEPAGA
jgi:tRNA threonylcarbamoyladenosine biosynthesis protein TsaB